MDKEFTIQKIRAFVKKDYQSVSARMVKSLLAHYDEIGEKNLLKVMTADNGWFELWIESEERADIFNNLLKASGINAVIEQYKKE